MVKITHMFILLSLLTAAANSATGSLSFLQGRNVINGVITNTTGRPIYNIRVELLDEVEMAIKQTYTDPSGRYTFSNLSHGTFIVKVHSDANHVGQSARLSLYAARTGGGSHYEQLDFVLKTREESKGNSVPSNTGPAFAQEVPENARKAYERGVKQLENTKQTEQGIASLKEAISIFPTYYLALERLGVEYIRLQQYQPAHETLTKALEVNPNGASCHYALGVAQFHLRQIPEAAESLRRSLMLAPESPNAAFAHFYLGLAYWKTGKVADAEPHLKKSYELGGSAIPADVHMHLAKYYSDNKRYKEAADELEMFLKKAPDARDAEMIRNLIKQLRAKAK
jgi:Flp pilus assembly protein TadD